MASTKMIRLVMVGETMSMVYFLRTSPFSALRHQAGRDDVVFHVDFSRLPW
jgi:hypothetical protein